MARVRVELNHAGMAELLTSGGVRAELTRRMSSVLAVAKSTAPVETGQHRDSGHIEQATTDRAAVRVVFDSDHSVEVEADTGHIARALDAAGGA
jgi:hypothetical protein